MVLPIDAQRAADPTAAILSVAMLFEHFGYADAAARISAAVEADVVDRGAGSRSTSEVGDAILARLH